MVRSGEFCKNNYIMKILMSVATLKTGYGRMKGKLWKMGTDGIDGMGCEWQMWVRTETINLELTKMTNK